MELDFVLFLEECLDELGWYWSCTVQNAGYQVLIIWKTALTRCRADRRHQMYCIPALTTIAWPFIQLTMNLDYDNPIDRKIKIRIGKESDIH